MKSAIQVASPPVKPLMVYDGDCNFCTLWIRRWQQATGGRVDFVPLQDPQVAARFPEIPREQFESAVHLIEADGRVERAAGAVFQALAYGPNGRWLLDLYQHFPAFARVTEWSYHYVASHRTGFSALTRLLWGRHVEVPSHQLARWLFLRVLGLIYLIAFASLWVQVLGLIGENGILPARALITSAGHQFALLGMGPERFHYLPTLCWLDSSDAFLQFQCAAGVALAVLLVIGLVPAPCLFLLWLLYLSLTTVGAVFLGFQWDNLLLETGFLAIFLAPLQWLPRRPGRETRPSRIVLWLLRWLLFRLMFESGCVKLLSHDPTWRNLTALHYHFETQPLPTWIAWYASQLPLGMDRAATAAMFVVELAVPFLIFAPRRPRMLAAAALIALQLLILLTGNYCFFNLLTIALCLLLLDDAALSRLLPMKRSRRRLAPPAAPPAPSPAPEPTTVSEETPVPNPSAAAAGQGAPAPIQAPRPDAGRRAWRWGWPVTAPLLAMVLCTSFIQFFGLFGVRLQGPRPLLAAHNWLLPFRSFNTYGLFAVMTTSRPEIIIQGSRDGVNWVDYEFKYKPGDLRRRPVFVEPYQPRLDWQMWFAALGDYQQNPWFVNFCVRLLQGSPHVLALLKTNPFPETPPRYIRAVAYDYQFTDFATRRRTGDWWRREYRGIYMPPISLPERPRREPLRAE